jgi:AcrB/AcrD/AcrF family
MYMRLGLIVALVGFGLLGCRGDEPAANRQPPDGGSVLIVTASYPGANALVVADTVAAPMEQQINGVEGLTRLESESRNDGTYVARLHFEPKTLAAATKLVEARIALAKPVLPDLVQRAGISVKAGGGVSGRDKAIIALIDRGDHGWEELQKLAQAVMKRMSVDGAVAKANAFPMDEQGLSLEVDRKKCAALGIAVKDVHAAVDKAGPAARIEDLKKGCHRLGTRRRDFTRQRRFFSGGDWSDGCLPCQSPSYSSYQWGSSPRQVRSRSRRQMSPTG